MKNLSQMTNEELIDELIHTSNSVSNTSESSYLMDVREVLEKRIRFYNEKIFRLSNIAHSGIDLVGEANYDDRIKTAHLWVENISNAKEF